MLGRQLCRILLLVLLAAAAAAGQEKLSPHDLNRVKDGGTAPDFTLEDQTGNRVTLSSFRGKKKVVLVFYRGYW
jgi:cytochrome oxidase Cu insertion factor (SCO1/SenC/PrrC family)